MSPYSRSDYLKAIYHRYHASCRKGKSLILREFCEVCGYHPKYAIRLLGKGLLSRSKKKPGKKPRYHSPEFIHHLKTIWLATDQLCSKRLKAALPLWLPYYKKQTPISPLHQTQLLKISPSTIDRILKPIRVKFKTKGLTGTKPGTLIRNQIPIRTHNWDITKPGFMEADTVHHCGNSLLGSYVLSLNMTDIKTGWTETRAIWTKYSHYVIPAINSIQKAIPFTLMGFDCDNGSEFLNHALLEYFVDQDHYIAFTRSRPYKKNDNAAVEQKNYTHVRQWLGYDRFEHRELVGLINALYEGPARLFLNFFCPNLKLIKKTRINSKYIKKYDLPQTPYQRVISDPSVPDHKKQELKKTFQTLNPFSLKKEVEQKLRAVFEAKKKLSR
jgi:hypothetical protein